MSLLTSHQQCRCTVLYIQSHSYTGCSNKASLQLNLTTLYIPASCYASHSARDRASGLRKPRSTFTFWWTVPAFCDWRGERDQRHLSGGALPGDALKKLSFLTICLSQRGSNIKGEDEPKTGRPRLVLRRRTDSTWATIAPDNSAVKQQSKAAVSLAVAWSLQAATLCHSVISVLPIH